jgi:hypothetical protein
MSQFNGQLVILPGPHDPQEKRTLKGEVLSYVFDPQAGSRPSTASATSAC